MRGFSQSLKNCITVASITHIWNNQILPKKVKSIKIYLPSKYHAVFTNRIMIINLARSYALLVKTQW